MKRRSFLKSLGAGFAFALCNTFPDFTTRPKPVVEPHGYMIDWDAMEIVTHKDGGWISKWRT